MNFLEEIPKILKTTFEIVDKRMCEELTKISKDATGTTVAVIIVVEKVIFVANLGNKKKNVA